MTITRSKQQMDIDGDGNKIQVNVKIIVNFYFIVHSRRR